MILSGSVARSQPTTQTYTNSGTFTWICPSGVTSVVAECWGAGGGGGCSSSSSNGGSGGGGGGYVKKNSISVTPGNTYFIFVGFGGQGGAFSGGADGNNSYFNP